MDVRWGLLSGVMLLAAAAAAYAGPWAEVGDAQVRSDVELAAAYGLLNNVTMQWPQPWTGILGRLQDEKRTDELPADVREAAARLLARGRDEVHVGRARADIVVDVTNEPATVRGYDALGHSRVQGQVAYEYLSSGTAIRLAVGGQKSNSFDSQGLVFDTSYIAHRIDGMIVYAGYVPHWWGPGWISSLSLSNNARPIPQIGLSRVHTDASRSWLLSWMGPWQAEAFVGVLDGPRVAANTVFAALRLGFNPLPGLEVGLSRITEMCGQGHHCQPLVDYFTFSNDPSHVNTTNEQGSVDIRYTGTALSVPYAAYAQFMNEDTNPFVHSTTSTLVGGSVWVPVAGLTGRLTVEYTNSIPTENIWSGPVQHGSSYNNYDYIDGMRYRRRALGFSLDSDSRLYSAQASVVDSGRRTWTLTYHRALVSHPLNYAGNPVTTGPVRFDEVEARLSYPLRWGDYSTRLQVAGRWQSDQPRPEKGTLLAFELALKCGI